MDRTNEAVATPELPPVTSDHGPGTTDRTNEAIAPAEALPVTTENGPPTTDRTNEAIAPIEPLPVTIDDGQGTTDRGPRVGRLTMGQKVIVLALLALLFSTAVAAALGNGMPIRAKAAKALHDHRSRLWARLDGRAEMPLLRPFGPSSPEGGSSETSFALASSRLLSSTRGAARADEGPRRYQPTDCRTEISATTNNSAVRITRSRWLGMPRTIHILSVQRQTRPIALRRCMTGPECTIEGGGSCCRAGLWTLLVPA